MKLAVVEIDRFLFEEGKQGSFFYIIQRGEAELIIKGESIKTFKEGQSFGELALLHGNPRSATIKAVTEVYVWCMDRTDFKKIINHINMLNYEENKKFVQSVQLLSTLLLNYRYPQ